MASIRTYIRVDIDDDDQPQSKRQCVELDLCTTYRQIKCELMAEMLSELWDQSNYNLNDIVLEKWQERVWPLIHHGLPHKYAISDMYMWFNGRA